MGHPRLQQREAVLIVHGIGEQRPLQTLFGFTRGRGQRRAHEGIVADDHAIYGGPDTLRGRADQRRLSVTWNHQAARHAPWLEQLLQEHSDLVKTREANTDFFELYWAYHFRDTVWRHLRSWFVPLVFRPRSRLRTERLVGPRSAFVHTGVPVLLVVLAALAGWIASLDDVDWRLAALVLTTVLTGLTLLMASRLGLVTFVRCLALSPLVGAVYFATRAFSTGDHRPLNIALGTLFPLLSAATSGFLLRGLGDAARYFSRSPDNVQETEQLRQAAVDLLERLHAARTGDVPTYQRIVVVGHSLGSVIAYDAIRFYWGRVHGRLAFDSAAQPGERRDATAVRMVEDKAWLLHETPAGQSVDPARRALWSAKRELLSQLRDPPEAGGATERWAISDFVTLGSPLTYADMLLAEGADDMVAQAAERIYAVDPPRFQVSPQYRDRRTMRFDQPTPNPKEVTVLHHAAPFAAVCWTNVYFRHDLVGGPVANHFGAGVRDVCLAGPGAWLGWFVLAYPHSSYWRRRGHFLPQVCAATTTGTDAAIALLRQIIVREPVVVVEASGAASSAALRIAAEQMAHFHHDDGYDVRVMHHAVGARAVGQWMPGSRKVRLTPELASLLAANFGESTRVFVSLSPDIRPEIDGMR